jgi:hypothetical protein
MVEVYEGEIAISLHSCSRNGINRSQTTPSVQGSKNSLQPHTCLQALVITAIMTDQKQDDSRVSSEHVDEVEPIKKEETNINLSMTDDEYDATEKKVVRKLDFTLLPMVWLLYFFNYLDRNNIAYVEKVEARMTANKK